MSPHMLGEALTDRDLLEELYLLVDVMVAASESATALPQTEVDQLLGL